MTGFGTDIGRVTRRGLGLALLAMLLIAGVALARDRNRRAEQPQSGLVFDSERIAADDLPHGRYLLPTDAGNVRLMMSNSGTFGTGFQDRNTPSMEWPARSGIDHLVRAALWVGAIDAGNGDTLVTVGGRDAYYQDAIFEHSEYTPIEGRPKEYSRLRTSPFYRAGTVSDENIHTVYVDTFNISKDRSEEAHTKMRIKVVQESYDWGFDPLDDLTIVEFNVINLGQDALQDVWIGIYSEMVTNDRQAYANWPPGQPWFGFQDPFWDAANKMLVNHSVRHQYVTPEPRAAIKVVGSGGSGPYIRGPDSLSTKQITLKSWNWNVPTFLSWKDDSLYVRMNRGQIDDMREIYDPNADFNPATIIAVGPFPLLSPGDTTQVVFAFLAGENQEDLEKNASWAQQAYDKKYRVPSPPSPPLLHVHPRHNELVLRWGAQSEEERDPASLQKDFQGYRVYLSDKPQSSAFRLVHQYDKRDGFGLDTGFDPIKLAQPVIEGADTLSYEVRLGSIPDGFKRYVAVTAYDQQDGVPPTLESGVNQNSIYCVAGPDAEQARGAKVSIFPNPYRGESSLDGRDSQGAINPRKRIIWFVNLPSRATIRLYTLAGDLVRSYEYDAATYKGTEAAGISPDNADLSQGRTLVTGGAMAAFDLLSENRQEISTGLYLFTVEDRNTGDTQQGKFLVLK